MPKIFRARAPLRLGFAGGGTDVSPYCDTYGGYVLNATVDMSVIAQFELNDTGVFEFHLVDRQLNCQTEAQASIQLPPEFVLFQGVYNRIVRDYLKSALPGFKMSAYSDAPPGSGLGASSTMVVTLLSVMKEAFNLPLGEYDLAHLAYEIERIDLSLAGGKQDQYAAAFGGVNFMEFYANDRVIVNPLRIKRETILELELSTLLYFTGVSRQSAEIIEDQRRSSGHGGSASLEALHRVKHDTLAMKEMLLKGQICQLGLHLREAWEAKRATSAKVSNAKIDAIVSSAIEHGAWGGKVSGAGGGGFLYFLVDPDRIRSVAAHLGKYGGEVRTVRYIDSGVETWMNRSSDS